jgi:hypothetical protein
MKNLFFCLLTLAAANMVSAQQPTYLWPIEGAKAGEGIIYAPQSYIDGELNFDHLFIAAPEGTVVVAPCDGTVRHVSVTYQPGLSQSLSWRIDEGETFDSARAEIVASDGLDPSIEVKYIYGSIGISTNDGYTIWIDGLSGDKTFKTGERIERGTPLGQVSYSYRKIAEPSISLAVSKGGPSSDPMTPFGLKTSFIPPAEIKPVVSLSKEEATEDFNIFIAALKECFVGLYNVITPEELETYVQATLADIASREGDIPYRDFRNIIGDAVVRTHDSHISMYPTQWRQTGGERNNPPGVWFGFFSDTLRVSNATPQFSHLIGRQIDSINGIPADSVRQIILRKVGKYDADSESFRQYALATPSGMQVFLTKPYIDQNSDFHLVLTDGEKVDVPGITGRPEWVHTMAVFPMLNRHREGFATKMLTDSVAYLGIGSFSLNQVQVETIGAFIDSISTAQVPNLVIDVRNNDGGTDEVINGLYSYIAGEEMTLHGFSKVTSNTTYRTFAHSLNQIPDTTPFPDYQPEEGRDGFYLRPEAGNVVRADSLINYKGRIYMLTNENSVSAATLFPAMLVRNHRGVTVGRETRSAYHFMNALKFVEVRLPASQIAVRLPLVEVHFDDVVNERVPYGRGVMPDYPFPLSLEELVSDGDAMLDYTLGLIERGEYFRGDNPFAEPEKDNATLPAWAWGLIIAGVVGAGIFIAAASRKSKAGR